LCGIIYASDQRGQVPGALHRLATGTLTQQVAAAQMLVDRGKMAESLKGQPRWVQTAAVKALLEIGTPEAVQQLTESVPVLDEPVGAWATASLSTFGRTAIGPLVECLQNKDGAVRTAAQAPLTKIGGAPVIAALQGFMGAYDDYVRASVVAVLSGLGEPAAPVAIKLLLQKGPGEGQTSAAFARAQNTAMDLLVAMKEPALPFVVAQLLPDKREQVRSNAALMLGRLAGPLGPKGTLVVSPLLTLAADQSWSVRRRAASALGELKVLGQTPAVLGALTALLQDNDEVKAAAVKSLGLIASPSSAEPLVTTLITNREGVTLDLVTALQLVGPPALSALGRGLQAAAPEARELATQAVAAIGTPAAPPLLAGRLSDSAVAVRQAAALALETQATPSVVGPLVAALSDSDARVYGSVLRALTLVGKDAVAPLVARLGSGDPRVSLVVSEALTTIGAPAVGPLAEALRSSNANLRQWAASTLGDIAGPALPALRPIAADAGAPASARVAAALALGRTRLPEAIAPLTTLAAASAPEVRRAALQGLAWTRRPEATTPLLAGLSDADSTVRLTAADLAKDWQIGDADAQLTKLLAGSGETKRLAAVALAFHSSPGATPLLGALFGVPALAADKSEVATILNSVVVDPAEPPMVRRLALIGLAYRGDQQSVDAMATYLDPRNPLAPVAARAIGILGGRMATSEGVASQTAQLAAGRLLETLGQATDPTLRLQIAASVSLMQGAPVAALLDRLNTAPEDQRADIAAILGALGKPANDAAMKERGLNHAGKEWVSVSVYLIGNPDSLKFMARLPKTEQPSADKVEAARVLYDRIMKIRASAFS
jgi:HEAT repeat protein